jgi:hypothetical protein
MTRHHTHLRLGRLVRRPVEFFLQHRSHLRSLRCARCSNSKHARTFGLFVGLRIAS